MLTFAADIKHNMLWYKGETYTTGNWNDIIAIMKTHNCNQVLNTVKLDGLVYYRIDMEESEWIETLNTLVKMKG